MSLSPDPFSVLKSFYFSINPELTEEEWANIAARYYLKKVNKGMPLLEIGEVCDFVGIVYQGLCRMYHLVDDKEVIFEFFDEGKLISDYTSFMLREPSLCVIQALEDSEIFCINYTDVEALYESYPPMYKMVTAALDGLYVANFDKYSSVLLDDLETAYRRFLTERASIVPSIHQYMIASYLGVTPEALTRTRRSIGM